MGNPFASSDHACYVLRKFTIMYSSIWASWSAWSFCTGKVQVRVRACNTVRGYSCQGPNREVKPCDVPIPKQEETDQKEHTDYDAHDSFEADRREALKQLNIGNDLSSIKQKTPNQEFRRQLSAGRTPELKGPPLNSIGRQPDSETAHAPSMTPELLYERKQKPWTADEIPKKHIAFASKNTKDDRLRDNESTTAQETQTTQLIQTTPTTKQPVTVDKDIKTKSLNAKLRDSQSVSSSVLVGNNQRVWSNEPGNQPPRLTNRLPFTRAPFNPTTQRFTPTTSRFVASSFATTKPPAQQPSIGRGDEVVISSSVQQHFKVGQSPLRNGIASSINELKLRDSNGNTQPEVHAEIKEEPLATALDLDQPNSSDALQETSKPELVESVSSTIAPPADSKPLIAQKPTEEEIETLTHRFEKTRLSGEAGQLKGNLHSGEVNHNKLPAMNDETAKALEWMLRNMSDATQPVAKPTKLDSDSIAPSAKIPNSVPSAEIDARRAFASKTLPEGRITKDNLNRPKNFVPNPDEEGKQLESELVALKESMQQMETELKELRDAEVESQEPKFNIRKAINLNLVPNAPQKFKAPVMEEPRILEKPSELFLLDTFEHKSNARWSEWSSFGDCFCNKRIRTRNCIYDDPAHSEGCEGKSYESVICIGGRPCPAQRKNLSITRRASNPTKSSTIVGHFHPTTSRFYFKSSSQETTERPPHGDLFYHKPLPISRRQL
ncbi:hypothetical protein M3Y97_00042300 [Aphelenchoides bicaudatus]|nr:hypothetical protein M3Y97_00042300 [Aphelenchoides bicaudatus]